MIDYFAAAAADRTCRESVIGLGAFSVAAPALLEARNLDIYGETLHRVLESDFEIVANIVATLGAIAALARSAEHVREPENVAQDVAQIRESCAVEPGSAGGCRDALMAETVVSGALLPIAQDAIGFRRLFELLFRGVISRIPIRMKL